MTRHQENIVGFSLLVGTILVSACGGGEPPPGDRDPLRPDPTGTELVVGSTLEEWGILVLEREGGTASWRPLRSPGEVSWEGTAELPPFEDARPAGGSSVVLRASDGAVSLYAPTTDVARSIGEIPGDVSWTVSDHGAVLSELESGRILAVDPDSASAYDAARSIDWAGAVEDGIAILASGPELLLVPPGTTEPVTGTRMEIATPGLVTAWGRRLAFVDSEDASAIRVVTVDPPETAGRVGVGGAVTALAASPSSHQLYAGIADPAGVEVVNRFAFTTRPLASLDRPPVSLRPSLFGEYLLAWDGTRIWRIVPEDGRAIPIPGGWDADLPLGLPDGQVLSRSAEGEISLHGADGGSGSTSIEASPGTVWLAVRWAPQARAAPDSVEPRPVAVPPGRPAPVSHAGESDQDPAPPAGEEGEGEEVASDPGVPPGYYAIVGSARQRSGIDALVEDLGAAGFPVQVQVVADRAGENWYRGLVGPFDTRAEAEAAARQLQRERQLQSWVTGIQAND